MALKISGIDITSHGKLLSCSALVLTASVLAGCVGSPTYGTGKPAGEQLFEDVTGVLSIGPRDVEEIEYKPRPELVKPASKDQLPPPQENVLASGDPAWPEAPEDVRARLRAEATENRDNLGFRPKVKGPDVEDGRSSAQLDRNPSMISEDTNEGSRRRAASKPEQPRSRAQLDRNPALESQQIDPNDAREEFNKRLAENYQGNPNSRKYLSEPPVEYRQAAETAPVGDVGVDEDKKEARRKAEARKKSGKSSWRDFVPWL